MCSIFEILNEIKKAFVSKPKIGEKSELILKPDIWSSDSTHMLEFALLKVINKVASKGMNIKNLFNKWDKDGSGHLDANEILYGIEKDMQVILSKDETIYLNKYLD